MQCLNFLTLQEVSKTQAEVLFHNVFSNRLDFKRLLSIAYTTKKCGVLMTDQFMQPFMVSFKSLVLAVKTRE